MSEVLNPIRGIGDVSLVAQNTFTPAVFLPRGNGSLTVNGTFVGTLTVQRAFDYDLAGGNWKDIPDPVVAITGASAPYAKTINDAVKAWWRIGFKTGDYTSGTAVCNIAN